MSDSPYGVYVRIQNPDGVLWSSNREEHALVDGDLRAAFGNEVADAILSSLKGGFVTVQQTVAPVVQLPVVQTQADDEPDLSDDEAIALAEAVLSSGEVPVVVAPASAPTAQQFERCTVAGCGGIKDQWKPPGVGKGPNGKKYPGFWGCNNFTNHPRK